MRIPLSILIVIITMGFLVGISDSVIAQNPPAIKEDITVRDPGPPQITDEIVFINVLRGRQDFISVMSGVDSDFVFKQVEDVNGLPRYIGVDQYNTSLEIIGNENVMKVLKWTIVYTFNKEVNTKELTRMARFVSLLEGEEGIQWLADQVKQNMVAHPLEDYSFSAEFVKGRKMTFNSTPKLKSSNVTIVLGE